MSALTDPIKLTKDGWLELHRMPSIITASQIPTILGLNSYCSPFTLYQYLVGNIPWPDDSLAMRLGHMLEPVLDRLYQEATGRVTEDPGEYTMFRHPEHAWLFCTPDRLTWEANRSGDLQLKTTGEFNARRWKDGPPLEAQVQTQFEMAILGLEWGSLAGLVGNREFKYFDFERNDRFIKAALGKIREFHERLQNNDPPPVDSSQSTADALKAMHPDDNGTTVFVSGLGSLFTELEKREEAKKKAEEGCKEIENQIRAAIGEATFGEDAYMRMSLKTQTRPGSIRCDLTHDVKSRLDQAGIAYKITKPSTYRVLRKVKFHERDDNN